MVDLLHVRLLIADTHLAELFYEASALPVEGALLSVLEGHGRVDNLPAELLILSKHISRAHVAILSNLPLEVPKGVGGGALKVDGPLPDTLPVDFGSRDDLVAVEALVDESGTLLDEVLRGTLLI
jgi:hypothetical protein